MIRNVLASAVLAWVVGVSGCGGGEAEAGPRDLGLLEQAVETDAGDAPALDEVCPLEEWDEVDDSDVSVER